MVVAAEVQDVKEAVVGKPGDGTVLLRLEEEEQSHDATEGVGEFEMPVRTPQEVLRSICGEAAQYRG